MWKCECTFVASSLVVVVVLGHSICNSSFLLFPSFCRLIETGIISKLESKYIPLFIIMRFLAIVIGSAVVSSTHAFSVQRTSTTLYTPAGQRSQEALRQGYKSQQQQFPLFAKRPNKKYVDVSSSLSSSVTSTSTVTSIARPDPSSLLSARGDVTQRIGFVAICASLALGTFLMIQGLTFIQESLPFGWYETWRDYTWPVPLGCIFAAAGVTHFVFSESYIAFVPPRGTWGNLWQVPAPGAERLNLSYEEYHTYWTGVAEILGGTSLALSGLHILLLDVKLPALCLGLLTAAVTPANIYMATHDVQPPDFPPVPYPNGHLFRGVMQCFLLSVFYKLAFP
jgi:uncharacterized membrane protein